MVPILYEATETAFESNGLGRLTECTACTVTEERNGEYEAQFTYPTSGHLYGEITEGRIIACTHDDDGDRQPFIIYKRSAPINGLVTFNCRHLSYRLSNIILNPFEAVGITAALQAIKTNSINANPFTFVTDKTVLSPFSLDRPASVRQIMGGSEGSLLDVYGGEYEYDKFTVHLWTHRGQDAGVSIRYGKNMSDMLQTLDTGNTYDSVVPYWIGDVDDVHVLVVLPERIVSADGVTDPHPVALDMSDDFDEQPTEAQLRQAAADYLANNEPWSPLENITVDFVQLWNTTEYKDVANLQKVRLCDTVSVYYPAAGIRKSSMKVIKTVYNVLADRFDEIELGQPVASFADTILQATERQVAQSESAMAGFFDAAIKAATDRITGATGGHIVIVEDANGKPQELLIIDGDTLATSTNILRMNLNGIGFSTDGGQTYSTAWTIDGRFVADFITAGKLKAITIEGPTPLTFWDLATGVWQSYGTRQLSTTIYPVTGSPTVISYTAQEKTNIDAGVLSVIGKKETDPDTKETTFTSLGVRTTDAVRERYPGDPSALSNDTLAYPHGGVLSRGYRVEAYGGSGDILAENKVTTEYNPLSILTPDRLELGKADNPAYSSGTNNAPDRNVLQVNGGWVNKENAILFYRYCNPYQRYSIDEEGSGTWEDHIMFDPWPTNNPSSVAWDLAPGDEIDITNGDDPVVYCMGTLINEKKEIVFQLPLSRPVSPYSIYVHIDGTIHARQGSTVLCNNDIFDSRIENGAHYFSLIRATDCGLALKLHHWGTGSWSTGTLYTPVFITLRYMSIKVLYEDENPPEGDPT